MEARIARLLVHPLVWLFLCLFVARSTDAQGFARRPDVVNTQNFIVFVIPITFSVRTTTLPIL